MKQATNEKFMNDYRLQYWLYAIVNKTFGAKAKMIRDSLHAVYQVNRHGFDLKGVSTTSVMSDLSQVLLSAGYKKTEDSNLSMCFFMKECVFKNKKQKCYVSLILQKGYPSRFGEKVPDYYQVCGRVYEQ